MYRPVQYIPVKCSVTIHMNANVSPRRVICCARALPEEGNLDQRIVNIPTKKEMLSTHLSEEETCSGQRVTCEARSHTQGCWSLWLDS